jgi:hypothetical protein
MGQQKLAFALFGGGDQLGQFGLFFRQQLSNRPALDGVGLGFQQFPVVLDVQLNDPACRRAHAAKSKTCLLHRSVEIYLIMIKLWRFFCDDEKQIARAPEAARPGGWGPKPCLPIEINP